MDCNITEEKEMDIPILEYRWTMGNILTIIALALQVVVLAGGGLWYASKLEGRIDANTSEFRTNGQITDKRVESIINEQKLQAQQIQSSAADYGRMDERLIAMQAILLKIDQTIERISK